jgi:hypothetical protein
MSTPPDKVCATCGRRFSWRRAWADRWDEVRYCSNGCRRHRPGVLDRALEDAILSLLAERRADASICPSEAACHARPEDWREQMERTRRAARRLVAAGRLEITQGGRVVDPSTAKGPIRLRLPRS